MQRLRACGPTYGPQGSAVAVLFTADTRDVGLIYFSKSLFFAPSKLLETLAFARN